METPASRAAATGGKPLGTEGLSVFPAPMRTSEGSAGEAFAAEVERAVQRANGGERQRERLDELESTRREARRAGFGRERESEGEAHAMEAVFRREHAPVQAELASVAVRPGEGSAPATEDGAPAASCSPCVETRPGVPVDPAQRPPVILPSQAAALASVALPRAAPELAPPASVPAPSSEIQPFEPASLARAGGRTVRPAGSHPTPQGPDPAVLERAAEILRQIQLHATPHVRRLTLDLEPAELGRLSVQLALRAGRVAAIVRGENPETLALLEQREAELLQVLAERGIAAESVRFELGFGGQRSRRGARAPAESLPVPSGPAKSGSPLAPRESSSSLDLHA